MKFQKPFSNILKYNFLKPDKNLKTYIPEIYKRILSHIRARVGHWGWGGEINKAAGDKPQGRQVSRSLEESGAYWRCELLLEKGPAE